MLAPSSRERPIRQSLVQDLRRSTPSLVGHGTPTICGIFETLGCEIRDGEPEFSGSDKAFQVWRALRFELTFGDLLDNHREQMKDTVIWNIEAGQKLTGRDVSRAEQKRTELFHRVRTFLEDHEYQVCPVNQVPPFDIGTDKGTRIWSNTSCC